MGMYDYVDVKMPCHKCGRLLENFQTKDRECNLGMVKIGSIHNFYGICDMCGAWNEYIRHAETGKWAMFREYDGSAAPDENYFYDHYYQENLPMGVDRTKHLKFDGRIFFPTQAACRGYIDAMNKDEPPRYNSGLDMWFCSE